MLCMMGEEGREQLHAAFCVTLLPSLSPLFSVSLGGMNDDSSALLPPSFLPPSFLPSTARSLDPLSFFAPVTICDISR